MKSHTRHPANNAGGTAAAQGQRRSPEVITAAQTRSSSKLATHTAAPHSPTKHK